MTDASGATIFNYDTLGRLTTINYGNGIRQNYAYDKADRVSNLKVMQGSLKQMNLNYEYDKVGRLTAVRDNGKKFGYQYNAIGQLTEELNGVTGIKSSYQYYPSGNIKNLRHWDGKNVVSNYEYRYDMRGNQVQKDEGTGATKYYYDALSRIKTAITPDKTQNYEYDDLDNIKELTEVKGTKIEQTNYLYDKDSRLLLQETNNDSEATQRRFTYDAVGNQLTKDEVVKRNGSTVASKTTTNWYDGFNQLSRVQNPDGQFIDYTYNGNGLRTKKDFGDKATNYYYNGSNIILETDKNNAVTAKNVRGLHLIYRESYANSPTDPTFLYYLHNAHGDVTQLLNEKGQVVKDYRYNTFGQEEMPESKVFGGKQTTELWRQEVEKIDNPFRYCGEYLDEETGNYYLRARYYDPSVQRFITEDSYGVEHGSGWLEHLYNYCDNDPMNQIDPSGHAKAKAVVNGKTANTKILKEVIGKGKTRDTMFANPQDMASAIGGKATVDLKLGKAAIMVNGKVQVYQITDSGLIRVKDVASKNGLQIKFDEKTKTAYVGNQPTSKNVPKQGTGNLANTPGKAPVQPVKNSGNSGNSIIPTHGVVSITHSAGAGGGYGVHVDFLISSKGIDAYFGLEGNAGPQLQAGFAEQFGAAWNVHKPGDYSGWYWGGNASGKLGPVGAAGSVDGSKLPDGRYPVSATVGPAQGAGAGASGARGFNLYLGRLINWER